MSKENGKLFWITGLKGVAALIVFVHHFFLFFYPAFCNGEKISVKTSSAIELKIAKTPLNIFGWGGNFAVCLFFMISGFLIAYSYFVLNKRNQKISTIFKRYFSLMFPILFSSILIFIVLKSGIFRTKGLISLYKESGFNNYFRNFDISFFDMIKSSLYGIFSTSSAPINPPLWTMKAELCYSMICMLILYVFGKDKKRIFVYLFLIILNVNNYFLCFVLGMMLCDTYYNRNYLFNKFNKNWIKLICLIFGLYLASYTYIGSSSKIYSLLALDLKNVDLLVLYHTLGSLLIMIFILQSDLFKKVLSSKFIVNIGNLSLDIYLYHWTIINTISMFIVLKVLTYTKYYIAVLISLLISTVILLIISKLSNKYIQKYTSLFSNKIVNAVMNIN